MRPWNRAPQRALWKCTLRALFKLNRSTKQVKTIIHNISERNDITWKECNHFFFMLPFYVLAVMSVSKVFQRMTCWLRSLKIVLTYCNIHGIIFSDDVYTTKTNVVTITLTCTINNHILSLHKLCTEKFQKLEECSDCMICLFSSHFCWIKPHMETYCNYSTTGQILKGQLTQNK